MKTKRTDPHRPGAIIPVDYTFEVSFWWGSADCPDGYGLEDLAKLVERHPRFRDAEEARGRCDVCGARYTHGGAFVYRPTGQTVLVGGDCARKYNMLVNYAAFDATKEMAKRATAAALTARRNRERREAFLSANPGVSESLACGHHITNDLSDKLTKYGSLSDAQVNLAHKLHSEAWCPARPSEINVPAPEGRQTVRGVVVSCKSHESQFGTTLKMTVKVKTAAGTWLCWGTVPATVQGMDRYNESIKGRTIEFTATLQRGRDAHFALFKRPTGCRVVDQQPIDEARTVSLSPIVERPLTQKEALTGIDIAQGLMAFVSWVTA